MMKKLYSLLLILISLFVLSPTHLSASHIIGGEFSYECLGSDMYELELTLYKDCDCVDCFYFHDPAWITVYDVNGFFVDTISLGAPDSINVQPDVEGLCVNSIPDLCVDRGVYSAVTSLPSVPGGFTLVHQLCCRNGTILNIQDPGQTGTSYLLHIPTYEDNECDNSSPVFNEYPPIIICVNQPLEFDHSAFDPDGDSLVYELCTPFDGGDPFDPVPNIAFPPPFQNVEWTGSFDEDNMIGSSPAMTIDFETGLITAFPNMGGQFVVGICVSEYRDGELIGTSIRDFEFNVTGCTIVLADAGVDDDVFVCQGDDVQLNGNITGASSFEWSPIEGLSDPNILNPIVLNPQSTVTYTLLAANNTGCNDIDEVTIFVVEEIEADAGEDVEICLGAESELNASGGEVYSWDPIDGLSDPNISNPIASPSETTLYTVTVSDANLTCIDIAMVTVFVGTIEVEAGEDITVCPGEAAQLGASGGDTYEWTPVDGLDDPGIANPTANVEETTQYTVLVMDATGCSGIDSVTVFVSDQLDVSAGEDITVCPNQEFELIASGGSSYSWTPSEALDSPDSENTTGLVTETTTFVVNVSDDNGCSGTDTIVVTVDPLIEVEAGENQSICVGGEAQLEGSGGTAFIWTPQEGLSDAGIPNPIASPDETTEYFVQIIDQQGCSGIDSVTVFVNSIGEVSAGDDVTICPTESTILNASGGISYSWTPIEGLSDPLIANPVASPGITTLYTVEVTDENDCSASDEVMVNIKTLSDPGTITNEVFLLCDGEEVSVSTVGTVLENGDVLNYNLHIGGTIYASNSTGEFDINSSPDLETNTEYYITVIVGPDDGAGNVEVGACSLAMPGPTVVFLNPVSFVFNEDCDWENSGDFFLVGTAIGGLPQYDGSALYTIIEDFNGQIAFGENFIFSPGNYDGQSYQFTVSDDGNGCTTDTLSDPVVCFKTAIELSYFEGRVGEKGNLLEWSTASETNNDFFTLLHSTDGSNFTELTRIDGAGNSNANLEYRYIDVDVSVGYHYYQLIQTDYGGQTSSSDIIVLSREGETVLIPEVFPNPVVDYLNIVVNETANVQIYDIRGQLIYEAQSTTCKLNISDWPTGLYFVKVVASGKPYLHRIVKK